jgi:alpha-1,2-glucosyltransferase
VSQGTIRSSRDRGPIVVALLVCLWGLSFAAVWADLTMSVRDQRVSVRFVDGTPDEVRLRFEQTLGLLDAEQQEGTKWGYRMADPSRERVTRLVQDPVVADTAHIERQAFRVELDRPDLYPWVRYLLEVLPGRALAIGFPFATLLLTIAGRRQVAPVLARGLDRAGLSPAHGAALAATFLVLVVAFFVFSDNEPRWDERAHWRQIELFVQRDWSMEPSITTLPGYHALIALAAWLTHSARLPTVRLVQFQIALATIVTFFFLARRRDASCATPKTLQFVFLPLLFPLFFMVYTDVASLGFVLLTALAASAGRYPAAGVLGLASCLVRQNNIVWAALAFAQAYVADHGWRRPSRLSSLLRYAPVLLSGVAVVGWLVFNRGQVAAGDVKAHPLGTPHLGNIFFLLFLSGVLFLPLWWGYRAETWVRLRRPATWVALAVTFALFWFGFAADHPYNEEHGFLRNQILAWATGTRTHSLVFFLPIAIAGLSLPSVRLSRAGWLVYPATVAFLLPSWLIEQRYYLIPLALLLADREPVNARIEWVLVAFSAVLSGVVFVLVEHGTWML